MRKHTTQYPSPLDSPQHSAKKIRWIDIVFRLEPIWRLFYLEKN